MRELSLFTGAGGGLLGTKLLGWTTIGYVEKETYCQKVLRQRIADGILDAAPIFGDIKRFISDGYAASYTGMVDVISAGFPCQPFSVAGKRKQAEDERNMWPATADVIRIVKPRLVLLENVPGVREYLPVVIRDLRRCGYDVLHPLQLGADDVGAPHRRKRVWILAYDASQSYWEYYAGTSKRQVQQSGISNCAANVENAISDGSGSRRPECAGQQGRITSFGASVLADTPERQNNGRERRNVDETTEGRESFHTAVDACGKDVSDTEAIRVEGNRPRGEQEPTAHEGQELSMCSIVNGWPVEPDVGRVAYGVASRVDRLKAIGNGQVPRVVATAWRILNEQKPKSKQHGGV